MLWCILETFREGQEGNIGKWTEMKGGPLVRRGLIRPLHTCKACGLHHCSWTHFWPLAPRKWMVQPLSERILSVPCFLTTLTSESKTQVCASDRLNPGPMLSPCWVIWESKYLLFSSDCGRKRIHGEFPKYGKEVPTLRREKKKQQMCTTTICSSRANNQIFLCIKRSHT